MSGAMPYLKFLRFVHKMLSPRLYVEIGVRNGASLKLSKCQAIGIDPAPDITARLSRKTRIYPMTSDKFFEVEAASALKESIDLAFIDGMHLAEFALRDFLHIEQYAHSASLIVFDDIFPNHPVQSQRHRQSRVWTGDIWKIIPCLQTQRPDLLLLPVDTHPTGLLMVVGLDPGNRHLGQCYSDLARGLTDEYRQAPPREILERTSALAPDDRMIRALLKELRGARDSGIAGSTLKKQFRA